ncbi:DUF4159 domain-containing protein [Lichenibacterium ramalinae]|uniref:DUF4159 domain-containing protein n=1 Tax=Lichenibacterium ramalinae TaxID=2316527 RepID=A0A4Q2RD49_9HYPH|nr:DUF4159 domain-containing protein [Lichenibacterium ramalinae]RYB04696.1 DUF4159 domain-containing protein [Lichenibacterium ramalinae]
MLALPLAFTVPAVLGALVLLPALWFLLRVTPPRPRQQSFPPLRLILDAQPRDETPARTPPWLLILRLAIAAAIILAMAGPIWNPPPPNLGGSGPLALLIDDGFAAAPDWDLRVAAATERLAEAGRAGRPVALAPLSDGPRALVPGTAASALDRLRALRPVPVLVDRAAAVPAVRDFAAAHRDADLVWIADGLENGNARAFAEGLGASGLARPATVLSSSSAPLALAGAENRPDALAVTVLRADGHAAGGGLLRATDLKGLPIGEAPFAFPSGATQATVLFALPVEVRNDIARVEVVGEASAGAVTLLDGRWKRRRVDIVSGASADVEQPLLSPAYFIGKALAPFADVRDVPTNIADPIAAALDEHPSVLVLADIGQVTGAAHERLARFVAEGGVLLRFAGSRLAGAPADDLEPVNLRRGGRTFGGALSWDKPKALAPFDRASPFFGLTDGRDVSVSRQVLAEPDAGLPAHTWAQLDDGTPLVTADRRGKGTVVLFHVTGDTTWSNLPLSGLFVDMLRRIVAMSAEAAPTAGEGAGAPAATAAANPATVLPPSRILDGFGVLGAPPVSARPVPAGFAGPGTAEHPPGFYGPGDALLAVNALAPGAVLRPADLSGLTLGLQALRADQPLDLRAALITLALLGFLADALAMALLGGGFAGLAGRLGAGRGARSGTAALAGAALLLAGLVPAAPGPARAAEPLTASAAAALARDGVSKRDMDAALRTRLAYVPSGDPTVDDASREGLKGLSRALAARTSLDPGEPVAVDPARDELAFYPMLYWPVVASAPQPGAAAIAKVSAYMKNGGTVLFDTRDALTARPDAPATPEARWLATLLAGVDVPELEPVPRDHVITKTFYLLGGFVGRYTTAPTWVEALPPAPPDTVNLPARSGDSVSPIVITGNDLAAAWASDADGDPLYPLVPGGQRQREMALRGGINLVIYTLTGNYKADQVHVPDLLDRLAH